MQYDGIRLKRFGGYKLQFREKEFNRRTKNSQLNLALTKIERIKQVYGEYQKTIVHFHTPASHDFKFVSDKKYLRSNANSRSYASFELSEVIQVARDYGLFNLPKITDEYLNDMVTKNPLFDNQKELITYLLIAMKLINNSIKLAVITDHNTVDGYERLKDAINILRSNYQKGSSMPKVIFGVEISCGDSLHVVGITDDSSTSRELVTEFLTENVLSVSAGTYLTSWEVIEWFRKQGFISYVAHINTSNVFKSDYGSGAYKKRLLSSKNMRLVGVSKLDKKDDLLKKLSDRGLNKPVVFLDEDSHCLEDLATKTFWVKGQELNFNMLRNAIEDSDISIRFDKPNLPAVFVKSVSINGDGFLGKQNSVFSVSFSTALNCIIGGRGTGKSTLLDCVSFVLSQHVRDLGQLKNICKQGQISLSISVDGKVYYLIFNPALTGVHEEAFLRGYLHGSEHQWDYLDHVEKRFNSEEIAKATRGKIQIFSFHDDSIYEITDKAKFLNYVFRSSYSVNELVKTASDRRITDFIESQLNLTSMKIRKIEEVTIENDNQLKEQLDKVSTKLDHHKKQIIKKIERINTESNRVRVVYSQQRFRSVYFDWKERIDPDLFQTSKRWFKKYNIDFESLLEFFRQGTEKFGIFELYLLIRQNNIEKLSPILLGLTTELTIKDIENSILRITNENVDKVLSEINDKIVRPVRFSIYGLLNQFYQGIDQFDLQFDINSFENETHNTVFKSISETSLGQKVVALLDFIFMFGDVTKDVTPLLLDQPEDNLDSTYIYQHLVESLRQQKDSRQVLIVTHNSTIVTNSKPEQVISLQSDNEHGWVKKTGYPTESEIVLEIINLLEGGVASFKHKEFVYSSVVEKTKVSN